MEGAGRGHQNLWEVESQDLTQALSNICWMSGLLGCEGQGWGRNGGRCHCSWVTTGWVVEMLTELWALNYGELGEEQVWESMNSVWAEKVWGACELSKVKGQGGSWKVRTTYVWAKYKLVYFPHMDSTNGGHGAGWDHSNHSFRTELTASSHQLPKLSDGCF